MDEACRFEMLSTFAGKKRLIQKKQGALQEGEHHFGKITSSKGALEVIGIWIESPTI